MAKVANKNRPTRQQQTRLRTFNRCLLVSSAVLVGAFLLAHGLGLRQSMTVFNGTHPDGAYDLLFAVLYVSLYLSAIWIVPVLCLFAALMWGLGKYVRRGNNV